MSPVRQGVQRALVAALTVTLCLALRAFLEPPFTDAEIKASLVDTWGAHAVYTAAALTLVVLSTCIPLALAVAASRAAKGLALLAVALGASNVAVLLASHIALTERTSALTGQRFGGFYGLF